MRAPLHQRTKKIGACIADPFANGEGAEEIDTLAIPGGAGGGCIDPVKKIKRVRVSCQSRQCCELTAAFYRLEGRSGSFPTVSAEIVGWLMSASSP
jgi:hypothetical protein